MNDHSAEIITDPDFTLLQNYAREKVGIILNINKKEKIYYRIAKRLKILNLSSIDEYIHFLKFNDDENEFFINMITNFTTDFFREINHFNYLHSLLTSNPMQKKKHIRIWSAGCASGEEPYSIAITLLESIPNLSQFDIKILATDINTNALEIAKKGVYSSEKINKLGKQIKWFTLQPNSEKNTENKSYHINAEIQSLVKFKKFNFMDPWPMRKPFDIIFFRNVSIYMTKEAIKTILANFNRLLKKDGVLIFGHTESLDINDKNYIALGNNIFKKIEDNNI